MAAQFKTVLAKKSKPLILGSYITHLAVQLGVLNLQDHDLHLAFEMELLNMECLEKMGVVECLPNGFFQFTFLGPVRAPGTRPLTQAGPLRSLGLPRIPLAPPPMHLLHPLGR